MLKVVSCRPNEVVISSNGDGGFQMRWVPKITNGSQILDASMVELKECVGVMGNRNPVPKSSRIYHEAAALAAKKLSETRAKQLRR